MWNVLSVASFILPPSFLSLLPHPLPISCPLSMVPVCLSSNALDSISVVALRRVRLVPGWVTVLGRIDHLGTETGTKVDSAWSIPPWADKMSTGYAREERRVLRNSMTLWAGILAYSRLKALAVNGASHPVDVQVVYDSLIAVNARRLKASQMGWAPSQRTLAVYTKSFLPPPTQLLVRGSAVIPQWGLGHSRQRFTYFCMLMM